MISLGCSKNLVDSELILGCLRDAGFDITSDEKDADVIVVNTCGFIASAKEESINTIPVSYTHLDVYKRQIPMPAAYLHMGYDLPKDATDPRQERMNF